MKLREFLGGHPVSVAIRLLLISLVVGMVLSFLGVTPRNFFYVIDDVFRNVYDFLFGAFDWIVEYIAVGALLVVPIWLLIRLLSRRSDGQKE